MTLQAKLGIAALTIGSGGVATYASLVPKITGKAIKQIIIEDFKYLLLDTQDGDANKDINLWKEKWNSYKKDNTKNTFELDEWDKKDAKDLKDKLRQKCEILSKKEVPNKADLIYQDVIKYCARNVTIKDHAEKDELDLIKSDADATATWNKVAKKHAKLKSDFDNLNIKAPSGTSSTITGAQVKTGCEEAIKKHKGEDKYNEIYDSYKKVCVTEATKDES